MLNDSRKITTSLSIIVSLGITLLIVIHIFNSSSLYTAKSALCTWAADTRIINKKDGLSETQQIIIQKHLLPGDILISHVDWFVSNIGIPGFWTHAAVYVGTPEERKIFFDKDPEFSTWVMRQGFINNCFEQSLTSKNHNNIPPQKKETKYVIIEALGEGVVLSTFNDFSFKNAVAILRPRASKIEIAYAIQLAYSLLDTPYDFDFDFKTDTAIACTELVYRMYEDVKIIPLNRFMGKTFTTCNDIAADFDKTYGTSNQNLDLVMVYIDNKLVLPNDYFGLNEFRSSWR